VVCRFWPNNKSKMYVLEHSGDFLRAHRLRVGDVVQFCRSELGHLVRTTRPSRNRLKQCIHKL
jgi:hypothetical protein